MAETVSSLSEVIERVLTLCYHFGRRGTQHGKGSYMANVAGQRRLASSAHTEREPNRATQYTPE